MRWIVDASAAFGRTAEHPQCAVYTDSEVKEVAL